jgi:hypothetical protein
VSVISISEADAISTFLGPSPYLSENDSPFISGINAGTIYLETFEDHLLDTPGVSASNGGVTSVVFGPESHDSVDADDGNIDGYGLSGDSFYYSSAANGIVFSFYPSILGELPTAVGIVWTDGAGTTTFEAFGPDGGSLGTIGPVAIADGTTEGTTAEDRFFGIIDAGGISAIKISNTSRGIEIDHLQYGRLDVDGPDLTGLWKKSPERVCRATRKNQKCIMKTMLSVNNIGNRDAPTTFVTFALSEDEFYDAGDLQLKTFKINKLKAKKSKLIRFNYKFDNTYISTDRYLLSVIDSPNLIAETDEINNVVVFGPMY